MGSLALGAITISFAAVFVTTAGISADASAFYRMLFGGLCMVGLLAAKGRIAILPRLLIPAIPVAIIFTGDFLCWHRAILAVGPGLATMLGNLQAVYIALFSVLFLGERSGVRFFAALGLALSGVYLTVGPVWNLSGETFRIGVLFGIATAVFYGSYILMLKRLVNRTGEVLGATTAVTLLTALFCGLFTLASGESFVLPDLAAWSSMVALGALCQCGGWLLIARGLDKTPASLAGLVLLLQPVLSFVWDIWFFAKPVNAVELSGVALALSGIYLGSLRRAKG
ncbi:DMT family transporter [Salidesulfovibrio brasiliensis]|uniref:DMT family transporter n=1 Tax=Salidesulfovibrio brasiliensis TaxID=221711 RepID=UPI0006D142DE|nr:DMT family transporter [Salidesulfovibrio brasiliensis]